MSDFDDVLERLLTDPGFQARLAADPAGALAGYHLSADELELLQAQVGGGDTGQSRVEQRTSKASMFGLFSSIGSGIGDVVHGHGQGGLAGAGHGTGGHAAAGSQGGGAGQSVARGLGALEQSGGRHAAGPDEQHGGLAGHLHSAVQHGAHASAGGAEAHASAGGVEAHAGPGGASAGGFGGAGLAEAPDQQAGSGLSEASDGPRVYASAGYGPQGSAGLAEAPDQQAGGSSGLAEADPHAGHGVAGHVTEVHSSSQSTVYRSSSAGIGSSDGIGEAGSGAAGGGAGSGRHGIGGALDGLQAARGGAPVPPPPGAEGGHHGVTGGLAGALRDGVPNGAGQAPTDGYHTRVDWDGDGRWDQHTYVNRADGGVDIVVDTDGDGRAEFIGHDTDRDGLINSSELDTNHDGVMDQRYEDLNGDGWLDRRTR
ncbi:Os1348 family NHLP clan protein [Dactylosporangium sp. NPDC050688]|uniref:Os1348 family NHLP clan protein n=1 Tax=Dactylosporangium sp. NPDC050688 TaxID=3157217 RepID=UPI003410DB02